MSDQNSVAEQKSEKKSESPLGISVSLQNPDGGQHLNTVAQPPPPGYYVIVGRGATAWYNHLTLLNTPWGRGRLSAKNQGVGNDRDHPPVMHVGYEDPWSRRESERMGQWPRMLNFFNGLGPRLGLKDVPPEGEQNDWLPADRFAAALREAVAHVCGEYRYVYNAETGEQKTNREAWGLRTLTIQPGFVGIIEPKPGISDSQQLPGPERARREAAEPRPLAAHPDRWHVDACPYRLSVFHKPRGAERATFDFVYAYKVDLCTGPGQPRLLAGDKFATEELYREHLPRRDETPERRATDDNRPRIIDGNEYIGAANDPQKTVIVFKANPVGAQSVQSALYMPTSFFAQSVERVWFVANGGMMDGGAAVPGGRNLLELVGNSDVDEQRQREISRHHPGWPLEVRDRVFKGRLHRAEWHEVDVISERKGKLMCSFMLHPYGDVRRLVPEAVPAKAEASLDRMLVEAGIGWGERGRRASYELLPGLRTLVDKRAAIHSIEADLLVYSLGQDRDYGSEGTVAYLTQKLGELVPLVDLASSAFVMGLTSRTRTSPSSTPLTNTGQDLDVPDWNTGLVRVLGSAMQGGDGASGDTRNTYFSQGPASHKAHGDTLPREAPAGGGGFNLAIANIRRANRFTTGPIPLSNASPEELVAGGIPDYAARVIIGLRSMTDRSYTVGEFQQKLRGLAAKLDQISSAPGLLAKLNLSQPGLAQDAQALVTAADALNGGRFVF